MQAKLTRKQIQESKVAAALIQAVFDSIQNHEWPDNPLFPIGVVEQRMKDFAMANSIFLASDMVYMDYKQIAHATRQFKKQKGISVNIDQLKNFPLGRYRMDMFYDKDSKKFVYTDYVAKYIISPARELKLRGEKIIKVAFVTAVNNIKPMEFTMKKYIKI